jgi:hypothetical protein
MARFKYGGEKIDDYMTSYETWENIKDYIPKNRVIWEPFYGDGTSGTHLRKLGFNVIHENEDFFINNKGDIIVSNIPFSLSEKILERLKEIDKPFIIIMPVSKISTQYFKKYFKDNIQIMIPNKRIHFKKLINGTIPENWKNACNFECFYYCYKINLEKDILFL